MLTHIYICIYINILVNARLALYLTSDGVLSLPIRVTMIALSSNSFCQTNAGIQETDFQVLFYSILRSIIQIRVKLSDSGNQLSKLGVQLSDA